MSEGNPDRGQGPVPPPSFNPAGPPPAPRPDPLAWIRDHQQGVIHPMPIMPGIEYVPPQTGPLPSPPWSVWSQMSDAQRDKYLTELERAHAAGSRPPWYAGLLAPLILAVAAAIPGLVAAWQASAARSGVADVRHVQDTVVIPNVHTAREFSETAAHNAAATHQEVERFRTMMRPPIGGARPEDQSHPVDGRDKEPPKP